MASKFKRGHCWYVKYKDAAGRWKNKAVGRSASALEAENVRRVYDAQELNQRHGVAVRIASAGLLADIEHFKTVILPRSCIGREKVKRSKRREQVVIENFVAWLRPLRIDSYQSVTETIMHEYFDYLVNHGRAARTRFEERRVLNRFFKWAIAERHTNTNPIATIPSPRPENKKPRFFTIEELNKIWDGSEEPYKSMFRFLFLTGLRIGELGNLEWSDYLRDQKLLLIRVMEGNKTKRELTVPLNAGAVKILDSLQRGETDNYIFHNSENGKASNNKIYKYLKRVMAEQKPPILNASPHTFRHSCASHMVINGVSLYVVRDILRHKSIKESEIYAHLSSEATRAAVDKLTV
jgi:integrase/recombinase XerD